MTTERLLDPTVETWALEYPGTLPEATLAGIGRQLREAMPGKRVIVIHEGGRFRPLSSLDAAWAEAEAALPEGWGIGIHPRGDRYDAGASVDGEWAVMASGSTPAAALRALAEALRKPVTA